MITQFRTLFTVSILHTYYRANCRDFDFVFPAETQKLFRDKKLLARVWDGKLHILFESNESGTPLISASGAGLRIGLKLHNPGFINFTDLGFDFHTATPLLRNAANPAVLNKVEEVVLRGRVFSHPLTGSAMPATVTLKDAGGRILQTEMVTIDNNRSTVSYDLNGYAAGVYFVEEAYTGDSMTVAYYCDSELQQAGIFGILEIKVNDSFYASAPAFDITFQAREETLKYYVVAKNYSETDLTQLSVEDEGFQKERRSQIEFDKVASDSFGAEDVSPDLLGGSDVQIVLFKSRASVARREEARKKIHLKKNGDVLIDHLPQPGGDKADANVIVRVSKP